MTVYFTPANTARIVVDAGNAGLFLKPGEEPVWQDTKFEVRRPSGLLKLRVANNFPIAALFDESGNRVSPLIRVGDPKKIASLESVNTHPRKGEEIVLTSENGATVLFGIGNVELEDFAPAKINGRTYIGVSRELRGVAILCSEKGMQCDSLQPNARSLVELGKIFMEIEKRSEAEKIFSKACQKAAGDGLVLAEARKGLVWALKLQGHFGAADVLQRPSHVAKTDQQ